MMASSDAVRRKRPDGCRLRPTCLRGAVRSDDAPPIALVTAKIGQTLAADHEEPEPVAALGTQHGEKARHVGEARGRVLGDQRGCGLPSRSPCLPTPRGAIGAEILRDDLTRAAFRRASARSELAGSEVSPIGRNNRRTDPFRKKTHSRRDAFVHRVAAGLGEEAPVDADVAVAAVFSTLQHHVTAAEAAKVQHA